MFAAVTTTGVYCRPGCPGRPKRENVRFYPSAAEARGGGFRACKRCRPDEAAAAARRTSSTRGCRVPWASFCSSATSCGCAASTCRIRRARPRSGGAGGGRTSPSPRPASSSTSTSRASGGSSTCRWRPGHAVPEEVWDALRAIPYGETRSYGELAEEIGRPGGGEGGGRANGLNPLAIVVPCHRVIGSNRSLTGYAAGVERKRQLLELEAGVLGLGGALGPAYLAGGARAASRANMRPRGAPRQRPAHRRLRLRGRRPDRPARVPRVAAARGLRLPRRHRALPVRRPVGRRAAGVRARAGRTCCSTDGAKLLVVACNSATAAALPALREELERPGARSSAS